MTVQIRLGEILDELLLPLLGPDVSQERRREVPRKKAYGASLPDAP